MSEKEGNQTEEEYQKEMGKTSYPMLPGETKVYMFSSRQEVYCQHTWGHMP